MLIQQIKWVRAYRLIRIDHLTLFIFSSMGVSLHLWRSRGIFLWFSPIEKSISLSFFPPPLHQQKVYKSSRMMLEIIRNYITLIKQPFSGKVLIFEKDGSNGLYGFAFISRCGYDRHGIRCLNSYAFWSSIFTNKVSDLVVLMMSLENSEFVQMIQMPNITDTTWQWTALPLDLVA